MNIVASLTDTNGTLELPRLEVPFTTEIIEGATDVETLDGNIYTDFIRQKRRWTISYTILTEARYNSIKAYYDQQFITPWAYPLLSVPYFDIDNVPVRMYLNPKEVWKDCGDVQNVTITLRESRQI
jgi:hypothetical protein